MKNRLVKQRKRIILGIIVFVVVYVIFGVLIQFTGYDVGVDAIRILTSVIGAGCYWIGSNKR